MPRALAFLRIVFRVRNDPATKGNQMTSWRFWREALERAVKTAAQGVVLGLGMGEGFNLFDVDPMMAAGFAGGGALLSVLTSLATVGIGANDSPSAIS